MSHTYEDCHNQRCDDPHCTNPDCYNYKSDHSDVKSYYPHGHNSDHEEEFQVGLTAIKGHHAHKPKSVLKKRIHDHKRKVTALNHSETDVDYHESKATQKDLKKVDHALTSHVQPILEKAQDLLFNYGYTTGIFPEYEIFDDPDSDHYSEKQYMVSLSFYMYDTPVPDGTIPSKETVGTNRILFNRVSGTSQIQCQFNNSQIQSQLIPISFHHHDNSNSLNFPDPVIKSLVDDFITLVLLGKRSGLSAES